jgi:hypothetical protein
MRGRDGFAKIFASTHTPGPGKCIILFKNRLNKTINIKIVLC